MISHCIRWHNNRRDFTSQLNLKAFRTAFLLVGIFWVTWFPWFLNHLRLRITQSVTDSATAPPHQDVLSGDDTVGETRFTEPHLFSFSFVQPTPMRGLEGLQKSLGDRDGPRGPQGASKILGKTLEGPGRPKRT